MRFVLMLLSTALLAQLGPVPSQQQSSRPVPAVLEGFVFQAGSDDPIPKAQVTLTRMITIPPNQAAGTPLPPNPQIPPIETDRAGKFSFTDLEPGQYRLAAGKNGFVRANYGERTSGGVGSTIILAAGQTMKDANFRLVQTAAISGRVRFASGEPGAGMSVQVLKTSYNTTGQRNFQTVGSGRTDDRGEYRIFWMSPGRYYLAIMTSRNLLTLVSVEGFIISGNGSTNEIATAGLPTVFYPGVVDPLRASTIEVGAGREASNIDIVLPPTPVYRVRGRLLDASGQPPRSASISLVSRDTSISGLSTSASTNYNSTSGIFELRDVLPGSYWIRAQASESTATATIPASAVGRTLSEALSTITSNRSFAQMPLEVRDDIDGVALNMTAGLSVSGTLRVEGQPIQAATPPRVTLRPTASNGLAPSLQPTNADGTFTVTNVFPGEYRVFVTPIPPDYYIKEARIEQTDVLNQPWVIAEAIRGNLEVVLSSGAGQIDGTVLDAKAQPVSAIPVVLIPDQDRGRSELFRFGNTDAMGKFTLRGIPPGNYKIFAWENLEANAYYDPEILRTYEQQGKVVRVEQGSKLTAEVKLIPARVQ
jgi:hypothetical protein